MGVQVTTADNGQMALDLLQQAPDPLPWDIVLMDLQMPILDGHQATLALRSQARFDALPIIALTAHASAEEGERCLAEGMNEHLTKPIDPDALQACLERWAARRLESALSIPEVDAVKGLHLCGGKQATYSALLRKFAVSQSSMAQTTREAIEGNDYELASRTAHTLKGVAANLGADACSRLAGALELATNNGSNAKQLLSLLEPLERHLTVLLANISQSLPDESPADTTIVDIDTARVRSVCQSLADLLASSDAGSEQVLTANATLLRNAFGARFNIIADLIQNFEHAGALEALYAATAAANIDLGRRS
jgi:two-component system sensor histidine kinase/response regulator